MIPWKDMDERERAVWSATVAAHFVNRWKCDREEYPDEEIFERAMNLADRAIYALRQHDVWPPPVKPEAR